MDITFDCKAFSGEVHGRGYVTLTADGAALNGYVDASDIIEEYRPDVLLDAIDDADIIKYLTEQGYTVIEP